MKTLKIRVFPVSPSVCCKYASIQVACQDISLLVSRCAFSRRFLLSCLPSRSFCHGYDCHRTAGSFAFASYLIPPNVVTCLPVPFALPFRLVPLAWVRMPRFPPEPSFILRNRVGQCVRRNKLLKNVKSGADIIIMVIIHAVSVFGCLLSVIYR